MVILKLRDYMLIINLLYLKTYFLDGSMESTGQMFEGKKFNEWNEYHLNGRISIISNYNNQGQLNGNYYKYDNNGRIIYSATYFQDKLDGAYKEYYLDGEVALQGNYKMIKEWA